jgi:hypothetical protein
MIKRCSLLISTLLLAILAPLSAYAAPPIEVDGTASIASGANTIYLDGASGLKGSFSHIQVWLSSGSSPVNITFNSVAATTSNALLGSGDSITYGLQGYASATNQINYYGGGTTGTINFLAY